MADLTGANLNGSNLNVADLRMATLVGANLVGANLVGANLRGANLSETNLRAADLSGTYLTGANLTEADLGGAILTGAKLKGTQLIDTDLRDATLTGSLVYGVSVWNIKVNDRTKQDNLIITNFDEPVITVDNIKVAQFIYLLLNNQEIRDVIDTITSKAVLILGRFTPDRKKVLDAPQDALRKRDYLPLLFDFDRPTGRDFTETIMTLAIVAISNSKSIDVQRKITATAILQHGQSPCSVPGPHAHSLSPAASTVCSQKAAGTD